jgi:hypothetical protein
MRAGTFNINDYLNKLYEASDEKDEKEDKEHEAKESKDKEKKEEHEAKESDEKEEKEEHESKESDEKDEKEEKDSPSKSSAPKQSTPASKGSSPSSPKGMTNTDTVDQEGIILPEENKKFYSWLKGEYQKGKTEVKVEMKLGDSKFEPGYDMQSQPATVNDFKPGMFGAVKTAEPKGAPVGGAKTIGGNQPNTNNQVTGLSKPAEQGAGQGKELQKSKAMSVKSEPTKPMAGGQGKPASAGKPSSPSNTKQASAPPTAAKPEDSAEIEKIDIKTKKEKNAK